MSYHYQGYSSSPQPGRRRGCVINCLVALTTLVFLLLALALVVLIFVRPRVSDFAGREIGRQLEQQLQQEIRGRIGAGQQIPQDFSGEVVVTDAQVNQYIAAHPNEIAPLDSARIQFLPGEVAVDLQAYGVSGQARSQLAVQDGRVVVVNPRVNGPLGLVLNAEQIASTLEQELNNRLATEGKQVTAVSVEQGLIRATVESR